MEPNRIGNWAGLIGPQIDRNPWTIEYGLNQN
jgi:hypothetical protein